MNDAHRDIGGGNDAAGIAVLVGFAALLCALGAAFVLATTVVAGLSGESWSLPPRAGVLPVARTKLVWVVLVGMLLAGAFLLPSTVATALVWRRWSPVARGHATRDQIRRELSPARMRRTAAWTRPSLRPDQVKRAELEDLAVPWHTGPGGVALWLALENPTGMFAPTQAGKTRQDLVHKCLAAPWTLLASTTKPDLIQWSALARARRTGGPVVCFDATGTVGWPGQVRWSPITGCDNFEYAMNRAQTLVDAASVHLSDVSGGNEKTFRQRAVMVLQAYLMAAAHAGYGVDKLVTWATSRDAEPAKLLAEVHPQLAANLRAETAMVEETSDAVWMSVRRVIEPLMSPHLAWLCSPEPGEEFRPDEFLDSGGALYVIAGEQSAVAVAPILTALVEDVLASAQQAALSRPNDRLDPPFTAVLDELANATPLPRLPNTISDSAGRGILIHYALQSWAQAEQVYGDKGARILLDNTTAVTIFGGLKDDRTIRWLSTLCGEHDRPRRSRSSHGILSTGGSTNVSTETVPTYRPGDIRGIPRGRVLLIFRSLNPILARTRDVSARRDADQLTADRDTVRAGTAPIDGSGRLIGTSGPLLVTDGQQDGPEPEHATEGSSR